jgi:hypothetical protein
MAPVEMIRRDRSVAQLRRPAGCQTGAAHSGDGKGAGRAFAAFAGPGLRHGRRCATGVHRSNADGVAGRPGLCCVRPLYRTGNAPSWRSGGKAILTSRRIGCGAGAGSIRATASPRSLDHDDFGLNQSKIMNVIDSKSLERDAGGKPVSAFPHPALASAGLSAVSARCCTRLISVVKDMPGLVTDDDLAALYRQVFCFAFPSPTQRFGLPCSAFCRSAIAARLARRDQTPQC